MKPWIVGMIPSRGKKGIAMTAMGGLIARRLVEWSDLGLPKGVYEASWYHILRAHFETINLNPFYRPEFSRGVAVKWRDYVLDQNRGEAIVLCGRVVAEVFGMEGDSFWVWRGNQVVVPHPSGRNRIYIDPMARQRTGQTLKEAVLWRPR